MLIIINQSTKHILSLSNQKISPCLLVNPFLRTTKNCHHATNYISCGWETQLVAPNRSCSVTGPSTNQPIAALNQSSTQPLPSGELTFCHGKSPFLMGKSTISMAIFHCYVSSPEGNPQSSTQSFPIINSDF